MFNRKNNGIRNRRERISQCAVVRDTQPRWFRKNNIQRNDTRLHCVKTLKKFSKNSKSSKNSSSPEKKPPRNESVTRRKLPTPTPTTAHFFPENNLSIERIQRLFNIGVNIENRCLRKKQTTRH